MDIIVINDRTPHLVLQNQFSFKYRFPSKRCLFTVKSPPSVTQRSVSQENAFKKSKDQSFLSFVFSAKL